MTNLPFEDPALYSFITNPQLATYIIAPCLSMLAYQIYKDRLFNSMKMKIHKNKSLTEYEGPTTIEHMPQIIVDLSNKVDSKMFDILSKDVLLQFVNVIYKTFGGRFLNNFSSNLDDLSIKNFFSEYKDEENITAFYRDNEIHYVTEYEGYDSFKHTMIHELFHYASANFHESSDVGFRTFYSNSGYSGSFGIGLNEGVTEYLVCRFFEGNMEYHSYYNLPNIALLAGRIVGENNMILKYFQQDIYGFDDDYGKYSRTGDAWNLIVHTDELFNLIMDDKVQTEEYKEVLSKVYLNLFHTYINKLEMNGRYSKRKAISFLNSFDDNILIPVQLECLDEIGVSDFTKLKSSKSGLFEDFYNEYMKKKNESSFGV